MTSSQSASVHPSSLSVKGWIILGLLAVLVALTGGASRFDAIQIIPLRALSAFFLILSLFYVATIRSRAERMLVILFACLALIIGIQLVPLPTEVWQSLPARSDVTHLDAAVGLDGAWRPLTLAPTRTWNAAGSLVVPSAGLFVAIVLGASAVALLRLIAALGVLNAVLGLLQIVSGRSSALYLYEITNRGSPVGIFANENHAAMFAACSMLAVATLGIRAREGRGRVWERLALSAAFFLMLIISLIGGSRAGFAASIGVVAVSIAMVALASPLRKKQSSSSSISMWLDNHPRFWVAVAVGVLLLTACAFIALDRAPAFSEILTKNGFDDLRWSLWPVIHEMAGVHWVLGAGFGSFEQLYHIYEPSSLLMPQYVNQAHNDWAQLLIEGGALALFLLLGLVVWIAKAIVALSRRRNGKVRALFWISIIAIVGAASVIDYPLRTPLFQLTAIWLLVALSRDGRGIEAT